MLVEWRYPTTSMSSFQSDIYMALDPQQPEQLYQKQWVTAADLAQIAWRAPKVIVLYIHSMRQANLTAWSHYEKMCWQGEASCGWASPKTASHLQYFLCRAWKGRGLRTCLKKSWPSSEMKSTNTPSRETLEDLTLWTSDGSKRSNATEGRDILRWGISSKPLIEGLEMKHRNDKTFHHLWGSFSESFDMSPFCTLGADMP